jgi:hypothetical protein
LTHQKQQRAEQARSIEKKWKDSIVNSKHFDSEDLQVRKQHSDEKQL